MSKRRRRQQKVSFIDKIVDQSISMVLSFLFATALIGGGGYLLFQFPAEKNAFDRQTQEFANRATPIRQFNDILSVFASGWFADRNNWQPEEVFIQELFRNITTQALDPTLKQRVLNWASSNLLRLTSESGHIEGFVFNNDFERAFQEQLLKVYRVRIGLIGQLDEMTRNWEQEQLKSRDERLTMMQALRLESMAKLQGIFPKVAQLQDKTRVELQQAKQTQRDLNSQARIIYLKLFLAVAGVAGGVSVAMLVGRAVIAKNARK